MLRLLVSLVAVAALAAGAHAQERQRVVWSKDLSQGNCPVIIAQIGFSPDGRSLLAQTASPDPEDGNYWNMRLCGFEAADGRELYRVEAGVVTTGRPQYPLFAFTSSDRVLSMASASVALRDVRTGRVVSKRPGPGGNWVGVWATKEREYVLLSSPAPHEKEVLYAGTLPAGPDDAAGWKEVGPSDNILPEPSQRPKGRGLSPAETTAVRPDGAYVATYLAAALPQESVLLGHGLKAGARLELTPGGQVKVPNHINRLRFSPDGLVLASSEGNVRLWDVAENTTGWKMRVLIRASTKGVYDVAFRPDGKLLAYTTVDEAKPNVWLADVATGKVVGSFRARGDATQVSFSPDGKSLATSYIGGRLDVWNVEQVRVAPKQ